MIGLKKIKQFLSDDTGAVTVDWVVLTAAIVALGAIILSVIGPGGIFLAEGTRDYLSNQSVGYESIRRGP